MQVDCALTGKTERCHCPATGSIGYLNFDKGGIPCLMSPASSKSAKTSFTVEAMTLDPEEAQNHMWIGINQTRANRYFEHFLLQNMWPGFEISEGSIVSREVKVGPSRIDFCIDKSGSSPHYIEIKTPLNEMDSSNHPNFDSGIRDRLKVSSGRLVKHMDTLSRVMDDAHYPCPIDGSNLTSLSLLSLRPRCSMVLVFMYDAPAFKPDRAERIQSMKSFESSRNLSHIFDSVDKMNKAGVARYQLNLNISETEVRAVAFFRLE